MSVGNRRSFIAYFFDLLSFGVGVQFSTVFNPLLSIHLFSFRIFCYLLLLSTLLLCSSLFFYLVLFFLYDLCVSSIRVAYDVLTPKDQSNPAILEMPLDVKSDIEIMLVTNLISLTPGTLSLDVTPDRKTLIVHAMFADDPDAVIAGLKSGMERMVKEVFEE